VVCGVCGRI